MRQLPALAPDLPGRQQLHCPHAGTGEDVHELRGLLHDIGHGLATMSLLLEVAGGDTPEVPNSVLDLIGKETARLLGIVRGASAVSAGARVSVRALMARIVDLADAAHPTTVRLRPGADAVLDIDPLLLGRVVSNLVDNAVRASGPAGCVEIVVSRDLGAAFAVIDVVDDGPGYHSGGPSGVANIGLSFVHRLLRSCGGRLQIADLRPRGARMRVILPSSEAEPVAQPARERSSSNGPVGSDVP